MNVCVLDGVSGTDHHAVAEIDSSMAHAGGVIGAFEENQITGLCIGFGDVYKRQGSDGSGTPGIDYQVPAEALTDSEFAAIYKEAQKYVGTPYVWGGSTPETGFDCSGYVCWVYNQNGYNVGRTTANGLWNKTQHISEAEAKPGDLVFFEGTYDTPGKSHVGIYLGNGKMVSAGDPIKYADIHSSYWQKYLSGFGRLSK